MNLHQQLVRSVSKERYEACQLALGQMVKLPYEWPQPLIRVINSRAILRRVMECVPPQK